MRFSFDDCQELKSQGLLEPPVGFRTAMYTDVAKYYALTEEHAKQKHTVAYAFSQVRKRVSGEVYSKVYPMQCRALDFSQTAFPAYRFILPEVIADDWLAVAGWHKFQRDHALHQPLTAYIILKLLTGAGGEPFTIGDKSLLDLCVNQVLTSPRMAYVKEFLLHAGIDTGDTFFQGFGRELPLSGPGPQPLWAQMWRALVIESLHLAAIFHDIGYPWQYVNMLESHLEHAGYDAQSVGSTPETFIEIFGSRMIMLPFWGYQMRYGSVPATWPAELRTLVGKALRKTHGLPGAIGFLYLNDRIEQFPIVGVHPVRRLCVEWAALAILMHDMGGIYRGDCGAGENPRNPQLRLAFDVDPLSCVLALADVLQDFNRPTAEFSPHNTGAVVRYAPPCLASSLAYVAANASLKIEYEMRDEQAKDRKVPYANEDQRDYFHPVHGYVDLERLGVSRVDIDVRSI